VEKQKAEKKLLQDKNKYQKLFSRAPDGIVLFNIQGVITECNRSASRILGLSKKELIGKHFTKLKILSPKDIPRYTKIYYDSLKGKVTRPFTVDFRYRNREVCFLGISVAPLKEEGKTVGLLMMFRDITQKVKAGNELADSEKRYKLLSEELDKSKTKYERLFSESPDGIITLNRLGVVTDCNRVALSIIGVDKKYLIGRHFSKVGPLHASDIPRYFKVYYEALKGKEVLPFEVNLKTSGGETLFSECHIGSLKEKGKVVGFLLVLRDITRRKEAESALVESEKRYKSLFKNSRDGIYKTTVDGKCIDVNPALVKMLGYKSREELLSLDIPRQVYVNGKSRPTLEQRKRIFEAHLKRKNGTNIIVEINSKTIFENKKPVYYEGIVRDITERKKAEEKIKYLSFHDYLTDLYNRAFFEEELSRLDTGRQLPLAIMMGDVNGLKIINDAYGHEKGDELLCRIARVLKVSFRSEDIVSRWGGDEFIAILPKTPIEEAQKILERIRILLKKDSTKIMPLSIAFGISIRENVSKKISEVIKEAEGRMYQDKLVKNQDVHSAIVSSLEGTLEEKDYETAEHIKRMKIFAEKLGNKLGLSNEITNELALLAALHDIGKISIADNIILKPRSLTREEWEIVKKHPMVGYRIAESSGELAPIAKGILYHHEWWNGKGYPEGIKGEEIPLISRIISIVDAYDSMTNDKPYHKAFNKEKAVRELEKFSGSQFDPKLVKEFIPIVEED